MRIILVRHGEPDYEKDCLTDNGRVQAAAVAERLEPEGIEAIYTSPMGRAVETATALAKRIGVTELTRLPWMRELSWGGKDGMPVYAEGHPWDCANRMIQLGEDVLSPDWQENPLFRHNRVVEEAARTSAGTDAWMEMLGYVREGAYYRCTRTEEAQHTVALFCHGGSSSAMLARLLNLTFPYVCATLHMPFTGVTIIRLGRTPGQLVMPIVELASDSAHLGHSQEE
ncbi:MAG: histidine phosphatase family protein [Clostridia bacterium]|nr:histidine phosphatase family protein [Clostridia bacterium]